MQARYRFILAILVLGALVTGPFLATSTLVWMEMTPDQRTQLKELIVPHLPMGTLLTALGFGLGLAVVRTLFRQYVQGLLRMAEHLRLMLGANRNFRVTAEDGPPEVQLVARAINDLAQQRDELMADVEAQIARAKASVEEEKNRLAALMSELAQAVVVCNLDGRILLYNNRARLEFHTLAQGPTSVASGALIGLGRSIFSIIDRSRLAHAEETIRQRLERGLPANVAHFITTTASGQFLRVQMVPVLAPGEAEAGPRPMTGYVLTVENITRSLEQENARNQALLELTQGNRAAIGNIRAAVETLQDYPDMDMQERERFIQVVAEEVGRMSRQLEGTAQRFADATKTRWPLEDVSAEDLIKAAQRRIDELFKLSSKIEGIEDNLWVRADSFSLIFAITFLAGRLADHYEIRELRFRGLSEGKLAYLDLIWSGHAMSSETFYSWEQENMQVGRESAPVSLREVLDRHGGEIWYQREKAAHRAYFRFVLPLAQAVQEVPELPAGAQQGRPEYYDFDLFNFQDTGVDLDRNLMEMAYTVFDTETTGLEPANGDEIIQIGAVRIVNGRLLRQESFDQLVDPQRPLRPEGIPIHGITEEMLRGKPSIDVVLPAFHAFCSETVLVAHNAAFDMRFLQLKEERTGLKFSQPVLDTLLLSAVIHPNQESHKLDVIAERLGVPIIGRHNALGDAYATGEVFLKMIPLLAEKGIHTLRQALEASQKTYFARVKY
ncbi:exonuclease domain-containing protein [Azovibrio restrictus]|uniref:3'-5' exonuclease n=1 Tax=Azovibrio restrictus TaxID=146938 RepID=UPI0026F1C873|nr:exonuclease domain-containing protein [Azovibrio restrictus]